MYNDFATRRSQSQRRITRSSLSSIFRLAFRYLNTNYAFRFAFERIYSILPSLSSGGIQLSFNCKVEPSFNKRIEIILLYCRSKYFFFGQRNRDVG